MAANKPSGSRLSRASELLTKLLIAPGMTVETVAAELGIASPDVAAFANGSTPIPVDAQLRIASIAIDRAPDLARLGHRLKGQAEAAKRYEAKDTETHQHDSRPRNIW